MAGGKNGSQEGLENKEKIEWPKSSEFASRYVGPFLNTQDPYGRGLNPQLALIFEALSNYQPFIRDKNMIADVNTQDMMKQGIYPVSPEFLSSSSQGSGTYESSGKYKGDILLNAQKPLLEMFNEIIPHELRHRETGAMGGVTQSMPKLDDFILNKISEEPYRLKQERYAYGPEMYDALSVLLSPQTYYNRGDFPRYVQQELYNR